MQTNRIALVLTTTALLVGCSGPEKRAQEAVAATLRDPSSAQFRGIVRKASGAVCGEVNGTNGYGGYAGFVKFYVLPDGTIRLDPGNPAPGAAAGSIEEVKAATDIYDWVTKYLQICVNDEDSRAR